MKITQHPLLRNETPGTHHRDKRSALILYKCVHCEHQGCHIRSFRKTEYSSQALPSAYHAYVSRKRSGKSRLEPHFDRNLFLKWSRGEWLSSWEKSSGCCGLHGSFCHEWKRGNLQIDPVLMQNASKEEIASFLMKQWASRPARYTYLMTRNYEKMQVRLASNSSRPTSQL